MKIEGSDLIKLIGNKPDIIEYDNHSIVFINHEATSWIKTSVTGKWIYDLMKEMGDIEFTELVSRVTQQYSLPRPLIKKFVSDFIKKLAEYQFVQIGNQSQIPTKIQNNEDRLPDELPNLGLISLWFSVTSECNLNCQHCFAKKDQPSHSIPLEKALHVFHEAKKLNVKKLYISGGEPLLHPQIVEIVTHAKAIADWGIIITTNGFIDDLELIEKISQQIHCFQFSVDGIDEKTHDSIRGVGSFKKVVNAIKFLHEIDSKVQIVLSFTPHPKNIHQITSLFKLGITLSADSIHITKPKKPWIQLSNINPQTEEFLSVEFRKKVYAGFDKLVKECLEYRKGSSSFYNIKTPMIDPSFDSCLNLMLPGKRACCGAGGNQLHIDELGDCYPCAALIRPEHLLGNVFQEPLEQIFQEQAVFRFRQSIHIDHIAECSNCSFRYFCAGDCRALAESSNQRSPYCELIKERYNRFLKGIAIE